MVERISILSPNEKSSNINKIEQFIFTSTFSIFEKDYSYKVFENEPISCKNYYGLSKLLAEKMLYSFYKKNRINIDILRIPRVIALNKSSFLHTMVKSAVNRNKIYIKRNTAI